MKLLFALCSVICVVGVYCEDAKLIPESLKDNSIERCNDEIKLDQKTLNELDEKNEIPNTPQMQCFLACILKKEGMMNEDGTFTKEFTESKPTEPCRDLSGKDVCEIGFKTVECLIKQDLIVWKTNKTN